MIKLKHIKLSLFIGKSGTQRFPTKFVHNHYVYIRDSEYLWTFTHGIVRFGSSAMKV